MVDLSKYGWDAFFEEQVSQEERETLAIARIVEPLRGLSRCVCRAGEIWAEHTEKSSTGAKTRETVPSTGDWVLGKLRDHGAGEKRMSIERVLTRKNKLSRAAPGGKTYEQILCTNVDTAFLVLALTQDLNLNAITRYLEILSESNVQPVIILTKVDADTNPKEAVAAISDVASGVAIHTTSVKEKRGLESIAPYFLGNKTVVLLGASGAGKSSLTNFLLGEEVGRVESVRESDQKGRHTTTNRRLYTLPKGGMVIDSPGIREIQKWEPPEEQKPEGNTKKKLKSHKHSRARRFTEEDDDY